MCAALDVYMWRVGRVKGWLHVQFEAEDAVERACRLSGAHLLDRPVYVEGPGGAGVRPPKPDPGKPVEGCWFCLSNPSADTELIVSIGKAPHPACLTVVVTTTASLAYNNDRFASQS